MRIILITFTLILGNQLSAQISLQIGGLVGLSKSKSFQEFKDFYNVDNQGSFSSELNNGSFNYGTTVQASYIFDNLYSGLGFTNAYNTAEATFLNGAQRKITFNSRYYNILIGYVNSSETKEWAVYSGFVVSDYVMSSYIKYATGDRDYTKNYISGFKQTQGFGIPLIGHFSKSITDNFWVYGKCQLQLISATKFGVFDYQGIEKQIKDDAKRMLFEIGVEFKLGNHEN